MTPRVDILPLIVIFLLFAKLYKSIFCAFEAHQQKPRRPLDTGGAVFVIQNDILSNYLE